MKRFVAIYIGTEDALAKSGWKDLDEAEQQARGAAGVAAWEAWAADHADAIVEQGAPLGRTKRVSPDGIRDVRNDVTGYVVVRAASHEAAAKLFEGHPHFTIMPGDSVEIMECLELPGM